MAQTYFMLAQYQKIDNGPELGFAIALLIVCVFLAIAVYKDTK